MKCEIETEEGCNVIKLIPESDEEKNLMKKMAEDYTQANGYSEFVFTDTLEISF
jgi:hypothetical protein